MVTEETLIEGMDDTLIDGATLRELIRKLEQPMEK